MRRQQCAQPLRARGVQVRQRDRRGTVFAE
jgi:hypothetical protein